MNCARSCRLAIAMFVVWLPIIAARAENPRPDPVTHPDSPRMLEINGQEADPATIDYASLPRLTGEHAVISPQDKEVWKFQLHNYLLHHGGQYWCMWSHGPAEDTPPQHVRYATSQDGLHWSESKLLTGMPAEGYGYIARGFWLRDGELLALVSHYKGRGAFGVDKELTLQAFVWDAEGKAWKHRGLVFDNAINNYAPERLANGEWMMTRRDARFNNSMLIGGVKALDDWRAVPIIGYTKSDKFRPDEPIWWPLSDKHAVGVFRDNGGSSRLFRAFSADGGQSWSLPAITNFPNSTSKVFSMATSQGDRLLVSNANPQVGRRELYISLSPDGLVFNRLALVSIPFTRASTFQYPHAIEHDGHLLVAFSRTKNQIEVMKIPLVEIDKLRK
jgi:hypothetical protein